MATFGVPTAWDRCMGPVSPVTNASRRSVPAANVRRERPRSFAGRVAVFWKIRSTSEPSESAPVRTTVAKSERRSASAAHFSPSHPFRAVAQLERGAQRACEGGRETSFNDKHLLPILHHHHIFADFPQASQGNQP